MRTRRMMARVLLVVAGLSTSARAQEQDWKKSIDAGTAAYDARCYDEAERYFHAAVTVAEKAWPEGPRLAEALYDLGRVNYKRRNYREAEILLRRALAIRGKTQGADVAEALHWLAGSLIVLSPQNSPTPSHSRDVPCRSSTSRRSGTSPPWQTSSRPWRRSA